MKKIGFIISVILFSFIGTSSVLAYQTINSSKTQLDNTTAPTGLSTADIQTTTGSLIKGALTIVGTVFLALMIYGGFMWMTARGEEDQIKKGKETIIAATIGLGIILAAYAITNVVTQLTSGVGPRSTGCTDTMLACENSCDNNADPAVCREACGPAYNRCLNP